MDHILVRKVAHVLLSWLRNWRLSLFEKVILVNSLMLIGEALATLWVTSHQLESHHYLIDTIFIVFAALFTLFANVLLLRASFRPLFNLLHTIREIGAGQMGARATLSTSSWEIRELAQAFNSMLDRLEIVRREQTSSILQVQEEERRRIGMELHDETGQNLTALLIHAEVLNQHFQARAALGLTKHEQQQLADELLQLTHLAQISLENVRILAQQLRPSVLDDLGLLAAFRWLGEDSGQRLRLEVSLDIPDNDPIIQSLPSLYETALFRIAQESLTNIARHAHAELVEISLYTKQQHIYLLIQDDGTGFKRETAKVGTGILGMRERATSLGGTLTIISQNGQGTTVQAILPLPQLISEPTIPTILPTTIDEQNKGSYYVR